LLTRSNEKSPLCRLWLATQRLEIILEKLEFIEDSLADE